MDVSLTDVLQRDALEACLQSRRRVVSLPSIPGMLIGSNRHIRSNVSCQDCLRAQGQVMDASRVSFNSSGRVMGAAATVAARSPGASFGPCEPQERSLELS